MSSATGPGRHAAQHGSLRWLWLTAGVIALDQLSKALIVRDLALDQSVRLLPVLQLTRLENPGAAFNFLAGAGGWQRWLFTALALIVSVALVLWLRRIDRSARTLAAALALIIGGALGNMIDRLRLGEVVDFIFVHWGPHYYPAFNVADSAITVGVGLLLLETWLTRSQAGSGLR